MPLSSISCSQGHLNSSDHRFCRLCGEPLPIPQPDTSSSPGSAAVANPAANKVVGQRYRIKRQLGYGGFGRTYLAEDINRFNEPCVLKEFAPQVPDPEVWEKAEQLFEREAGVLYQLQHPQIPCFRELLRVEAGELDGSHTQTPAKARIFLVQDYVDGQNYQTLLNQRQQQGRCFSEAEIVQLLNDVLPVLGYIHDKGVIHRDISPDNLMQRESDRLPVLIDFGGVKQAAISAISHSAGDRPGPVMAPSVTIVGKQGYAPYEQMAAGQVSPHSDFYALAMTVLVLMTGQAPQSLLDASSPGFWQTQLTLSPILARVLRKMLAPYPSDRYTSARDILAVLASPPSPSAAAPISSPTIPSSPISSPPTPSTSKTVAVAPVAPPPRQPSRPAPAPSPARSISPVRSAPSAAGIPPAPRVPGTPASPHYRQPSPPPDSPIRRFLVGLALVLGLGGLSALVGYLVAPLWLNSQNQTEPSELPSSGGELEPSAQFSEAEQERKAALRNRRDRLGISERFLVQLTDVSFYDQHPRQRGRALTAGADDAEWREKWDGIASQWLDQIETLLPASIRPQLGTYGSANRDQWQAIANRMNVGSRALYDLTDIQFFSTFPDRQGESVLDQPIGQIWHGMADLQIAAMQAGETVETIQFAPGAVQATVEQRLQPGSGHVFLFQAQAGQRMELTLDGRATLLSIYIPRPTSELPFLLEDNRVKTWSGELPQTGYYEVVVVADHPALSNRAPQQPQTIQLTIAIETPPTPEPDPPDADPPAADTPASGNDDPPANTPPPADSPNSAPENAND